MAAVLPTDKESSDRSPRSQRFYGRRQGRPLRPALQALCDRLLPQFAIPLPAAPARLVPGALFAHPVEAVWLEIGFGGGEHLLWQAAQNPHVGFLGAEYFLNGVARLLRETERQSLQNLSLHHGDARDLLDALPAGSIGRAFILFPDPWPKTRHHKRRLIQPAMLDRLAELLEDEAELRLATDDPLYLGWMLECLGRHPDFHWLAEGPRDWRQRPADWPETRYEKKALAAGRQPAYLRWRRCPRAGG